MASETARCRVVVVDRGRLFAEALAGLLGTVPWLEATSADPDRLDGDLLRCADVVLLGWNGRSDPVTNQLLEEVRAVSPAPSVILVVDAAGTAASHAVAETATAGCVSRHATFPSVVRAVQDARCGRAVRPGPESRLPREHRPPGVGDLTARELDVLGVVAEGLDNEAVGVRLGISPHTVRTHLQNITAKLGVANRKRAVAVVRQAGLLPARESTRGA